MRMLNEHFSLISAECTTVQLNETLPVDSVTVILLTKYNLDQGKCIAMVFHEYVDSKNGAASEKYETA